MCTLSWLVEPLGYQLFFNRDEQRSRTKALPPQHYENTGVAVLMPLDPDGGGSWIAVNEHGLSLCLLNFYQGTLPTGLLKSRGQLLKSLTHIDNLTELTVQLSSINLGDYAPFTLIAFARQFSKTGGIRVVHKAFQWDGYELNSLQTTSPMTSSSVDFESVSAARKQRYCELPHESSTADLLAYHQGHQRTNDHQHQAMTKKGHKSVCMHRDDAHTVSFSHIEVTAEEALFTYVDRSPCNLELNNIRSLRESAELTRLALVPTSYNQTIFYKGPFLQPQGAVCE
ncbi:MAG: NRDE family protein [Amphritea sp.]